MIICIAFSTYSADDTKYNSVSYITSIEDSISTDSLTKLIVNEFYIRVKNNFYFMWEHDFKGELRIEENNIQN